jgi:DNA polymerase-1
MARRPLLVIDGDSFAHRAYHGLPKTIRRKGDRPAGALVGFANYLIRLHAEEQPRAVFVGWDTLAEPNWRALEFPSYQGGREYDDDIVEQLDILPELVAAFGFAYGKSARFEADDFLATAAAAETRDGGTTVVATSDRDAYQLASHSVTILQPAKMGEMTRIDPSGVRERYGVEPKQVPDFIALRGDPSDKIPGARGIGEKTAASLLKTYADLEAMLADGKFAGQVDDLRLYRRIATMVTDAPLPDIPDMVPSWGKAAALAREWELKALTERLEQLAAG